MKGGRRGRRGGRRQKRREEKEKAARQEAPTVEQAAPTAKHEHVHVHVHEPEPAGRGEAEHRAEAGSPPSPAVESPPKAEADSPPGPAAGSPPGPAAGSGPEPTVAHPRPMSARELVARLEAKRLEKLRQGGHEARQEAEHPEGANGVAHEAADVYGLASDRSRATVRASGPRHFAAAGQEWIARLAGSGTGGTGRVAQARLEAIRFSTAAEPERVAAEVLVPRLELDALYDDELAELLERGLRSRTENG